MGAPGGLQDPATWGVELREARLNGIKQRWADTAQTQDEEDLPVVLLMHGWPESWFVWRHQLRALRAAGYRGIAPDMRGYGGTDAPPHFASYGVYSLAGDMLSLLQHVGARSAALVGHDHGAHLGWKLALMHPDIFTCYTAMCVPYGGRPKEPILATMRREYGDERGEGNPRFFYQLHHQLPSAAEDYARDTELALRTLVCETLRAKGLETTPGPVRSDKLWVDGRAEPLHRRLPQPTGLPPWISDEEFEYMVSEFKRNGWEGGMNWYRVLDQDWHTTPQLQGAKLVQPIAFIMGAEDAMVHVWGGIEKVVKGVKKACAKEPEILTVDGAGHWVTQECPETVTEFLLQFLHKHAPSFAGGGAAAGRGAAPRSRL